MSIIFLNPKIDASEDTFHLGVYYPVGHPDFHNDPFSKAILNIKYRHGEDPDPQPWKQANKTRALRNFHQKIDPLLAPGIAIAVVPSHNTTTSPSGIQELAQMLAANGRVDATSCLVRHKSISKQATGGARSVKRNLQTIRVENADLIVGKEVLLLDDVSTTGSSLEACKQLLLAAGASSVKCAVLGKTVSY
jgi:predicted amidophosphoribosyltransferase